MKTSQRTSACQCIKEVLNHDNMEFVEAIRREQQLLDTPNSESDESRLPDAGFIKQPALRFLTGVYKSSHSDQALV